MRTLYGSTSWRRVLALVLVFVMMVSTMGTSGYSVFAEDLVETNEEVTVSEPEAVTPEVTVDDQGPSPGEEESEAAVEPATDAEPVEASEDGEEPAADSELVETSEEGEEPAEEVAEPVEETEEGEEPADAETVEETEEGETVEETEEAEPAELAEDTLISEAAQVIAEDDGEAVAEPVEAVEELPEELIEEPVVIAMPAIDAEKLFDDARVTVSAPEGAFPEGTTVNIEEVTLGRTQSAAIENAVEAKVVSYKAYDITFNNGDQTDMQPAEGYAVKVNIEPYSMPAAENLQVVHMEDRKTATVVESESTEEGLAFDAEHFSVYVVVETGDDARLTVNFVKADGTTATMMINKRQADTHIEEYIFDPGTGTLPEGLLFKGWTAVENYNDTTEAKTIADVRKEVKTKVDAGITDGDAVTYYAMVFQPYTITYLDERGIMIKTDLVLARTDEETAPEYAVNFAYTPYPTEEVGVVAEFMGWQQIKPEVEGSMVLYDNGDTIDLSEAVYTLRAYTQKGHWLTFEENLSNASYTEPQFIAIGNKPSVPAVPTRTGYEFDGWYTADATDARDGQVSGSLFDFTQELEANTTVYAKWNPATRADYNVVIWFQNTAGTGYDYSGTTVTVRNAIVGNNTYEIRAQGSGNSRYARIYTGSGNNYSNYNNFTGFHLSTTAGTSGQGYDNPKAVAAEGNTIINVYYDRNVITYNFRYSYNNILTFSGLYGSAFTEWPEPGRNRVWTTANATFPLAITEFNPAVVNNSTNTEFTFTLDDYDQRYTLYVYKMTEDGEWNYTNSNYLASPAPLIYHENWTPTETYIGFTINAYRRGTNGNWTNCTTSTTISRIESDVYLRYARDKFDIFYSDGIFVDGNGNPVDDAPSARTNFASKTSVYYEKNINSNEYNITPSIDGYVFLGWYDNALCAGEPYIFDKMPAHNVTLYAKWGHKEYTVNLHPNDSTNDPIKYTNPDQATQFWPQEGEKIGNVGGERIYYDLVGWYTDKEFKHSINFDSFTVNQTMIGKYGTLYTAEQINPKYPTTVGELNLYAKWRSKLIGAAGINLKYDANGGTGAPKDEHSYADRAEAVASGAATSSDEKLVFSHWVVQKWNGSSYEDTDVVAFPGDTFEVLASDAKITDENGEVVSSEDLVKGNAYTYTVQLRADYTEKGKETKTSLNWYNNYDGGLVAQSENIKINEAITIPEAPTRTGYKFLGWIRGIQENGTTTTLTDLWITYDAENGYQYKGAAATSVAADENLVNVNDPDDIGKGDAYTKHHALYAKWEPISYTVIFDKNAEEATGTMENQTFKYDEEKALTANAFARANYVFKNWNTAADGSGTTYTDAQTVSNLTTDDGTEITLYAQWTPVTYTVITEYYLQNINNDDYTKDSEVTVSTTAKQGDTFNAEQKSFTGFAFSENNTNNILNGTISGSNLTLKVYYDRLKYEVSYDYTGDIKPSDATPLPQTVEYKYGATVTVAPAATATGYVFSGWSKTGTFVMPAEAVEITGSWSAADVNYTVEHYQQNIEDDNYTIVNNDTETKTGKTGARTEAAAKTYTGFTAQAFNQATIAADGSTVVKIYYNRNVHKVTYDYGTAPAGASARPAEASYKYGATVDVEPAATAPGYTFSGWSKTEAFLMPDKDVIITGTWTAKGDTRYRVEHYLQDLPEEGTTAPGYTLQQDDTQYLTGATGTETTANPKSYDGFTFNAQVEGTVQTGIIAGDGSLVLKLYYDRNSYKVTYDYDGTAPEGASALPTEASYLYGESVTVAEAATAPGHEFSGWSTTDAKISEGGFEMPASNVVISGSWTTNVYTVTWLNDNGDVLEKDERVPYGTMPTYDGATPTKDATAAHTYTFKEWNPEVVKVTGDASYTATYTESDIVYTITYHSNYEDVEAAKQLTATDSAKGAFPAIKSSDDVKFSTGGEWTNTETGKTYTFIGWNTEADGSGRSYRVEADQASAGTASRASFAVRMLLAFAASSSADGGTTMDLYAQWVEKAAPHLKVEKKVTSTPANGTAYAAGETITYTITVTNDGNVGIDGITVTDELTGNVGEKAWTIKTLPVGESETFTATYTVTQADAAAGSVKNTATAKAPDPSVEPENPDDPVVPDVPVDPGEVITPTTNPGGGGNNPRPRPNPDPTDEPEEPIDDPDTPLAPGTIDEPEEPIDDPDTPLAPYEEETEIDDEATPLTPFTGDDRHTAVWGFVSLLSLAGIVVVARKRREEE